MLKKRISVVLFSSVVFLLVLSACSSVNESTSSETQMSSSTMSLTESTSESTDSKDSMDEMMMEHNRNEAEPIDMSDAKDPKFPVGSQALITSDRMEMMENTVATIKGAYDTTLYQVTFTPEGMDEPMKDDKWIVTEEIEEKEFEDGDEVTLLADHMTGMENQKAIITGSQAGPAYMVDFKPNDGSEAFVNHKWLAEDELSPEMND